MRSNYRRLGAYIREVNNRNHGRRAEKLLGVNIDKFFMPSVANIIGTDLSVYKVVNRNQFACNRMHVGRDYRLPVALAETDEEFMVSPAYDVFEVCETERLLPEYLMMWFSRKEFDRNAWFYTDADVRGGLPWKAFCDMTLPVPSVKKQQEIVAEYHIIEQRIKIYQKLIDKLEQTAQTIYNRWFVDFEFPNGDGNSYKSSGNKTQDSELGNIPLGWAASTISHFGVVITGKTPSSECPEDFGNEMPFVTPGDFDSYNKYVIGAQRYLSHSGIKKLANKILNANAVIVTCIGSDMGKVVMTRENCITNQQMNAVQVAKDYYSDYLYYSLKRLSKNLKSIAMGGSTMPLLSKSEFEDIKILKPDDSTLERFFDCLKPLNKISYLYSRILNESVVLKNILLSKLATIED